MVNREVNYGDAKDNPYASNQPPLDMNQFGQQNTPVAPTEPEGQMNSQVSVQNTAPVQSPAPVAPTEPSMPEISQNPAPGENKNRIHWIVGISVMVAVAIVFITIVGVLLSSTEEGNLALDARTPALQLSEESYFNSTSQEAFIMISRGEDNLSLHRMELLINIGDTQVVEKIEAIAQNSERNYTLDLEKSLTEEGVYPGTVTIAPIYYVDAIESLGGVVSEIDIKRV